MARHRPMPTPFHRRSLAVLSAIALAGALLAVEAAVAPAPAAATEYCSNPDDASMDAENYRRYSRVRTRACLDFQGGVVVPKGVAQSDKPSDCEAGFPPSCNARIGKGRAEYHWVEVTVKANGRLYNPCRWDDEGAHDRTWTCTAEPIPNPAGAQEFVLEAQTCVDMKDDGSPAKCTAWATLRRAG